MVLSALQHIFTGLKRTRDQKLSPGLMLLMFLTVHFFQLHFADVEQYFLRPPGL